jgi:hypothetical protein
VETCLLRSRTNAFASFLEKKSTTRSVVCLEAGSKPPGSAVPRFGWLLRSRTNAFASFLEKKSIDQLFTWGQAPKPPGLASLDYARVKALRSITMAFCFFF